MTKTLIAVYLLSTLLGILSALLTIALLYTYG
jgi:hypothetical protein